MANIYSIKHMRVRFSLVSAVLIVAGVAFAAATLVCSPLIVASNTHSTGGSCVGGALDGNYLIPSKDGGPFFFSVYFILLVLVAFTASLRATLFLVLRQELHRRCIALRNLEAQLHNFLRIALSRGILHPRIY